MLNLYINNACVVTESHTTRSDINSNGNYLYWWPQVNYFEKYFTPEICEQLNLRIYYMCPGGSAIRKQVFPENLNHTVIDVGPFSHDSVAAVDGGKEYYRTEWSFYWLFKHAQHTKATGYIQMHNDLFFDPDTLIKTLQQINDKPDMDICTVPGGNIDGSGNNPSINSLPTTYGYYLNSLPCHKLAAFDHCFCYFKTSTMKKAVEEQLTYYRSGLFFKNPEKMKWAYKLYRELEDNLDKYFEITENSISPVAVHNPDIWNRESTIDALLTNSDLRFHTDMFNPPTGLYEFDIELVLKRSKNGGIGQDREGNDWAKADIWQEDNKFHFDSGYAYDVFVCYGFVAENVYNFYDNDGDPFIAKSRFEHGPGQLFNDPTVNAFVLDEPLAEGFSKNCGQTKFPYDWSCAKLTEIGVPFQTTHGTRAASRKDLKYVSTEWLHVRGGSYYPGQWLLPDDPETISGHMSEENEWVRTRYILDGIALGNAPSQFKQNFLKLSKRCFDNMPLVAENVPKLKQAYSLPSYYKFLYDSLLTSPLRFYMQEDSTFELLTEEVLPGWIK